jgi:quercetin dioxygenase-like cupin family protein
VFDNLISQGKMPVTIGLFINPGHDRDAPAPESPFRVTNRSREYDEVSDTYGRFLLEEMIPELGKQYNLSTDPKMRAICGLSSGGICAFSAAWFHPEQFHKVLSHIGSFTDIRGGHNYPPMIRKNDRKDIRVFLQDGSGDLDNQYGNWWLANQQMASALKYKDYDYQFVAGTGAHNGKHGGAILPQSLEWLWRDAVPARVEAGLYPFPEQADDAVVISGETAHFSEMEWKTQRLNATSGGMDLYHPEQEQIVIVKEGKLRVSFGKTVQEIGPNSVAVLLPGEKGSIQSVSPSTTLYRMTYRSRQAPDAKRGKKNGGSFIVDFDQLAFKPHDKGGIRNYFHRATAMCPYYEMHVTTLNPGIKSHEPHTHRAAEIILMIEGNTIMEIGNAEYEGKAGDVYFARSNVPHAIRNVGDTPCMYFAFQWE